ncbi:MAG: phosphoribosyltransferase [Spirochaetales bacterium]|nr:phosphoribosyltransferase [Spirochaetales bacterium]
MEKRFYSYNDIHRTVKILADKVMASPLKPEFMIAIGGGGFIPARILRTYLDIPIFTVNIVLYEGKQTGEKGPQITQWLDKPDELLENRRVLIVDEVDDSGATVAFCKEHLSQHNPSEIGLAVLHRKNKPKKVELPQLVEHYFCGEELGDEWICYPWDALDIDNRN